MPVIQWKERYNINYKEIDSQHRALLDILNELIALLIAGSPTVMIDLRKGGLAKLEVEKLRFGRCATLGWLLTPKQMKLIG